MYCIHIPSAENQIMLDTNKLRFNQIEIGKKNEENFLIHDPWHVEHSMCAKHVLEIFNIKIILTAASSSFPKLLAFFYEMRNYVFFSS